MPKPLKLLAKIFRDSQIEGSTQIPSKQPDNMEFHHGKSIVVGGFGKGW
jgi:hypothetical protein